MTSLSETNFKQNYQTHLKHLKLKGLQPKTVEAYSRTIRRLGERRANLLLIASGQRRPQSPSAHRTVRTGSYTAPHASRIH